MVNMYCENHTNTKKRTWETEEILNVTEICYCNDLWA